MTRIAHATRLWFARSPAGGSVVELGGDPRRPIGGVLGVHRPDPHRDLTSNAFAIVVKCRKDKPQDLPSRIGVRRPKSLVQR